MATQYNHSAIEKKWRENWEEKPINVNDGKKEKYYCLDMFPYPSGSGLHVGHWRGYVISDVWSRYQLLKGKYVIHPMGWDAFGLPAENYAIKMGVHPAKSTEANISNIKKQINIPVMGVGRINTGEMANKVIEEGKFDLVGIGRAQLADPNWITKVREGKEDLIRHCIGCDQGCYDAVINPKMKHITCTHNPGLCLEYQGMPKTDAPKKVMIVGGGMAGMIAAEVLKTRGHNPVIFEASDKLAGQFRLAGVAPMKQDWADAAEWEAKEVERLGIEVRLNTEVTAETIKEFNPDNVIIAVGSTYALPEIPGIDSPSVYSQYQVLKGEVNPTGRVAVIGCGLVGTEVAELLASRGAQVIAIERKGVGTGLSMLRRMFMSPEFKYYKIAKMSGTNVTALEQGKVHYIMTDRKTKEVTQGVLECDAAVICTGITARPSDGLKARCEELGIPVEVIGDAAGARDCTIATREGYDAGMAI